MSKDLLSCVEFPNIEENKIPLMVEFPVDSRLSPVLVSSSRSVLWVTNVRRDIIKAAIRPFETAEKFFIEILFSVYEKGVSQEWGNVHGFNKTGLSKAIEYVKSYGIEQVEVLVSSSEVSFLQDFSDSSVKIVIAEWLPDSCAVVVPLNREFLGFYSEICPGHLVSIVHNAVRGIGFAWDYEEIDYGDEKLVNRNNTESKAKF
jgi:hypothetical protein